MGVRAWTRRLLLGAVVAAVAAPLGAPAAQAAPAEESQSAIAQWGACLAGGGDGELMMLMDDSESIRSTDPNDARVTAATYFTDQLASYATATNANISVRIDTFDMSTENLLDWTRMGADSRGAVTDALTAVGERDSGVETDYWTALDSARRTLAARAADTSSPAPHCQAIVWFSDGELWINPRADHAQRKGFAPDLDITDQDSANRAVAAASQDLCRAGGLSDQLRSSGVVTFGIGLDTTDPTAGTFALMKGIATGQSDGGACGTTGERSPGAFYSVQNIDEMLLAFDALARPGQTPIEQEHGICQGQPCSDQGHRVVLDGSTTQVSVLAVSDIDAAQVVLQNPAGESLAIDREAHEGTIAGAAVTWSWPSERTVSIALTASDAAAWKGLWQLSFIDPSAQSPQGTSTSRIRVSGSLVPQWADREAAAATLLSGQSAVPLSLGIAQRDGSAVDPAAIEGSFTYRAELVDSAGTRQTLVDAADPAALAAPVNADLSGVAVGRASLELRLAVTTAATTFQGAPVAGTALVPEQVSIPVTILPPANYPTVGSRIDFGDIEDTQIRMSASLPVSGQGCVTLADGSGGVTVTAGPESVTDVAIGISGDACAPAAAGSVPLVLTADGAGNGSITGTVTLELRADGAGEPLQVTVPFVASVQRPLNVLNFWLVLIVALVLGPGIPLGVLYLLKYLTSTIPARLLYGWTEPVRVADGVVMRAGAPFALTSDDLRHQVSIAPRARRLVIDDVTLTVRLGWSPFGRGWVDVDAPGYVSASSTGQHGSEATRARLPLDIHNHWVVFFRPGDDPANARVLPLLGGADEATRTQLAGSISRDLPNRLASIVAAAGAAPTGPAGFSPAAGASDGGFAAAGAPVSSWASPDGWADTTPSAAQSAWSSPASASPAQPPGESGGFGGWAASGPVDFGWADPDTIRQSAPPTETASANPASPDTASTPQPQADKPDDDFRPFG